LRSRSFTHYGSVFAAFRQVNEANAHATSRNLSDRNLPHYPQFCQLAHSAKIFLLFMLTFFPLGLGAIALAPLY
jgi:hypothetical protein